MGRPKKYEDPKHISIVVECSFKKHIQRQAAYMSKMEGEIVSVNEAVRRGLEAAYPMNNQEMFKF
jgi:hypothetical protein